MRKEKIDIVVGLGFGDEGKGLTTAFKAMQDPDNTLVIRFSGGAQAAHNVVREDGISHIHSSIGSGALYGAPSYFTKDAVFDPIAFKMELERWPLEEYPKVSWDPRAKMVTPMDIAWNQIHEMGITRQRHGSCGMGVGATMARNEQSPYKTSILDMGHTGVLKERMNSVMSWYMSRLPDNRQMREIFQKIVDELTPRFYEAIDFYNSEYANKAPYYIMLQPCLVVPHFKKLVFEGSQGILLDQEYGIFPNVTYAHTTPKNVWSFIRENEIVFDDLELNFVTRCYQTRHGEGWMSDEKDLGLVGTENETNVYNSFQGSFRYGELDPYLLTWAMSAALIHSPISEYKRSLFVTCLDHRPNWDMAEIEGLFPVLHNIYTSRTPDPKNIEKYEHVLKNLVASD